MSSPLSLRNQILKEYYSQPHYRGLQADLARKYNVAQTTLSFWVKNSKGNQPTMVIFILAFGLLNLIFFVFLSIFFR